MNWAHQDAPAGGASFAEIVPATIVGAIAIVVLVLVALAYRRGGARPLRAMAGRAADIGGLPVWAALPTLVAAASLISAAFGFYWDVSTHIDNGRDAGPFANPSHYFILFGLAGIALAGYLSILLASDSPRGRTFAGPAPLGGILLAVCGGVAVAGFPLDDVWHRLFGQDVTLWGPTHIQMVGGAALATLASWVLVCEGKLEQPSTGRGARFWAMREIAVAGAFLIGLSALQAEFDFGGPQFQLVYQPVLQMLAAGIVLVAARIRFGSGGALWSVAFFLFMRAALTVTVGPVLGRSMPHFPLYLVEALVVEAVALRIVPTKRLRFALVSGAGIGTLGLAAEWAWSYAWMPNEWPAEMLPEALLLGLAAALAGAVIGGFIGDAFERDPNRHDVEHLRPAVALAGLAVMLFCLAFPAPTSPPREARADVTLDFVERDGGRAAWITVEPQPAGLAKDPIWFQTLAWQGREWDRGGKVLTDFIQVAPNAYRSLEPVPVHGDWKAFIRLHNEGYLVALPVYMPRDTAIPAEEVPALSTFTRDFVPDKELLQREARTDDPGLMRIGYGILAAIGAAWIALFAWALVRLGRKGQDPKHPTPAAERRTGGELVPST